MKMAIPIQVEKFNLEQLLSFLEKRNVSIPEFQRGYVWKRVKVRALFDSLIKRYPIGSFIIWKTNQKVDSRSPFIKKGPRKKQRESYLILDGQQRLLSLYYLCKQKQFLDFKDSFQEIYEKSEKNLIEFEYFYFNKKRRPELEYSDKFCQFNFGEFKKRLGQRYLFPVLIVSMDDYSKAIEIFERINQGGERISTEAIFLSEAWNKKTNLGQVLRKWRQKNKNTLAGNLGSIIFIHVLAIITQLEKIGNHSGRKVDITLTTLKKIAKKIKEEKSKIYEKEFRKALDAVSWATSFLRNEYGIKGIRELPSQTMVTVLSTFFYYCSDPNKKQMRELKKWFWRSSLGSRYIGSGYNINISTDALMMRDLAKYKESLRIPKADFNFYDLMETDINTGRSTLRNAIKLMLWGKEPRWLNGVKINREESELKKRKTEYDHFYAYNLHRKGIIGNEINSILNLCFLPKSENVKKRESLPSRWLRKRKDKLPSKPVDEKQFFASNLLHFKSIAELEELETKLITRGGKIRAKQIRKYFNKFLNRRFELFEKELNRLQRG